MELRIGSNLRTTWVIGKNHLAEKLRQTHEAPFSL